MAPAITSIMRDSFREVLRQQLGGEYPYMNREALERMLDTLGLELAKQAPATAQSMARSNFFTLPLELRDMIYEYVFMPDGRVQQVDLEYPMTIDGEPGDFVPAQVPQGSHSLLSASRQVRDGALPISWSSITLRIGISLYRDLERDLVNYHMCADKTKLRTLGPKQCAMIKKLVLWYKTYIGGGQATMTSPQVFERMQFGFFGGADEGVGSRETRDVFDVVVSVTAT